MAIIRSKAYKAVALTTSIAVLAGMGSLTSAQAVSGAQPTVSAKKKLSPATEDQLISKVTSSINRVGFAPQGLTGSSISKRGVVTIAVMGHAYRNSARKAAKDRHRASMPDQVQITLKATNSGTTRSVRNAVPSDLAINTTVTRTLSRDGVLVQRFTLPRKTGEQKSVIKWLHGASQSERDARLRVEIFHRKDTNPRLAGHDTTIASSMSGDQILPLKKNPKKIKGGFLRMKTQQYFIPPQYRKSKLKKRSGPATRVSYLQSPMWSNPHSVGASMKGQGPGTGRMTWLNHLGLNFAMALAGLDQLNSTWASTSVKGNSAAQKQLEATNGSGDYKKYASSRFYSPKFDGAMYMFGTPGYTYATNGGGTDGSTCADGVVDLTQSCWQWVRTLGLTIKNNTPFELALDYKPLSCVWATATPSDSNGSTTRLQPGGEYIDAGFLPINNSDFNSVDQDLFYDSVETLTENMAKTWISVYNGAQKSPADFIYSPGKQKTSDGGVLDEAIAGQTQAPEIVRLSNSSIVIDGLELVAESLAQVFLVPWNKASCHSYGTGQLWSVGATVVGFPQNLPSDQINPQDWNSNGEAVRIPGKGLVPVGVNNLPVPKAWGPPTDAYMKAHFGLQTSAIWNWNLGRPNNGPVAGANSPDQAGRVTYQGGLVQTIDRQTGTLNISFLGNDYIDYGPVPTGLGNGIGSAMRADVRPGGVTNEGGIDLTCHPGRWNLVTPWTEAGQGKGSAQAANIDMREITLQNVGLQGALKNGYNVNFVAYDANWNRLLSPGFDSAPAPGATSQFLNATLDSVSASITAADMKIMQREDGTPAQPVYYGCEFVGEAQIPPGAVFEGNLMKSATGEANLHWTSIPYVVIGEVHGGPESVVTPTIWSNPSVMPPNTSSTSVTYTGGTGVWNRAHTLEYFWMDCGPDPACTTGIRTPDNNSFVFGNQLTPPQPKTTLDEASGRYTGDWTPGNYFTFVVVAKDRAGRSKTAMAVPRQIVDRTMSAQEKVTADCTPNLNDTRRMCAMDSSWFYSNGRTNSYTFEFQTASESCSPTNEINDPCWTTVSQFTRGVPQNSGYKAKFDQTYAIKKEFGTVSRLVVTGQTVGAQASDTQVSDLFSGFTWELGN